MNGFTSKHIQVGIQEPQPGFSHGFYAEAQFVLRMGTYSLISYIDRFSYYMYPVILLSIENRISQPILTLKLFFRK
jgi:hypothetical protein